MLLGGKRVLVDYERGRIKKAWLPARLGGGLNESRLSIEDKQRRLDEYRAHLERQRQQNSRQQPRKSR